MIGGRFLVLFYVLSVSWVGAASAWDSDLRLVLEVRDKIHREYVDKVDSLRVIDAGLDGLVTALDVGDNLYRSPSELGLERASLDDRAQVGLLAEALQEVQGQYLLSVSPDSLQRGLVRGMLSGLGPHLHLFRGAPGAVVGHCADRRFALVWQAAGRRPYCRNRRSADRWHFHRRGD